MTALFRGLVVVAFIAGGFYLAHLRSALDELEQRVAEAEKVAGESGARVAAAAAAPAQAPAVSATLEEAPAAEPAQVSVAEPSEARTLTDDERATLVAKLSDDGMNFGSPVWFETVPNDPGAQAFQKELQSAFEDAGWIVKKNSPVEFSMKPGVYLFAAEENPPGYVDSVASALESAGIPLASNGRGYRAYYEERKTENPNWVGFEMESDQTFVLAIGRQAQADS